MSSPKNLMDAGLSKKSPIGLFDSGAGGLFVLNHLKEKYPLQDFIYMADTLNFPYGEKSDDEIVNLALQCGLKLQSHHCKAVIVACNTASSYSLEVLKSNLSIPVYGPIDAAVQEACQNPGTKKIGLLATKATIRSNVYQNKIRELGCEVFSQESPLLAYLVQEGQVEDGRLQKALYQYLAPLLAKHIDTILLGCTHYPYVEPLLKGFGCHIVDSSKSFIKDLPNLTMGSGLIDFIVTGDQAKFEETLPLYLPHLFALK